ncbi:hypothetical protein [Kytococcus sedentarius]|uniref:hypothetical protein n=1 Tax=Kytococcus sedentarius TaxID=1276 RepID=UPI0035BC697B
MTGLLGLAGCAPPDQPPNPPSSAATDSPDAPAASPSSDPSPSSAEADSPDAPAASPSSDAVGPAPSASGPSTPSAESSAERSGELSPNRAHLIAALRVAFDQPGSTASHAGLLSGEEVLADGDLPVTLTLSPGAHELTVLCSGDGAVFASTEQVEPEFVYGPPEEELAAGPQHPPGAVATATFAAFGDQSEPADLEACTDGHVSRATARVDVVPGEETVLWLEAFDDGDLAVAYSVAPLEDATAGPGAPGPDEAPSAAQLRAVRAALAPWPTTGQAHRAVFPLAPADEDGDHQLVTFMAPAYGERMAVTVHCQGAGWHELARQESRGSLDSVEPFAPQECEADRLLSRPHELISHDEVGMAIYVSGPGPGEEPLAMSYSVDRAAG